jgi:hypothetical protein
MMSQHRSLDSNPDRKSLRMAQMKAERTDMTQRNNDIKQRDKNLELEREGRHLLLQAFLEHHPIGLPTNTPITCWPIGFHEEYALKCASNACLAIALAPMYHLFRHASIAAFVLPRSQSCWFRVLDFLTCTTSQCFSSKLATVLFSVRHAT